MSKVILIVMCTLVFSNTMASDLSRAIKLIDKCLTELIEKNAKPKFDRAEAKFKAFRAESEGRELTEVEHVGEAYYMLRQIEYHDRFDTIRVIELDECLTYLETLEAFIRKKGVKPSDVDTSSLETMSAKEKIRELDLGMSDLQVVVKECYKRYRELQYNHVELKAWEGWTEDSVIRLFISRLDTMEPDTEVRHALKSGMNYWLNRDTCKCSTLRMYLDETLKPTLMPYKIDQVKRDYELDLEQLKEHYKRIDCQRRDDLVRLSQGEVNQNVKNALANGALLYVKDPDLLREYGLAYMASGTDSCLERNTDFRISIMHTAFGLEMLYRGRLDSARKRFDAANAILYKFDNDRCDKGNLEDVSHITIAKLDSFIAESDSIDKYSLRKSDPAGQIGRDMERNKSREELREVQYQIEKSEGEGAVQEYLLAISKARNIANNIAPSDFEQLDSLSSWRALYNNPADSYKLSRYGLDRAKDSIFIDKERSRIQKQWGRINDKKRECETGRRLLSDFANDVAVDFAEIKEAYLNCGMDVRELRYIEYWYVGLSKCRKGLTFEAEEELVKFNDLYADEVDTVELNVVYGINTKLSQSLLDCCFEENVSHTAVLSDYGRALEHLSGSFIEHGEPLNYTVFVLEKDSATIDQVAKAYGFTEPEDLKLIMIGLKQYNEFVKGNGDMDWMHVDPHQPLAEGTLIRLPNLDAMALERSFADTIPENRSYDNLNHYYQKKQVVGDGIKLTDGYGDFRLKDISIRPTIGKKDNEPDYYVADITFTGKTTPFKKLRLVAGTSLAPKSNQDFSQKQAFVLVGLAEEQEGSNILSIKYELEDGKDVWYVTPNNRRGTYQLKLIFYCNTDDFEYDENELYIPSEGLLASNIAPRYSQEDTDTEMKANVLDNNITPGHSKGSTYELSLTLMALVKENCEELKNIKDEDLRRYIDDVLEDKEGENEFMIDLEQGFGKNLKNCKIEITTFEKLPRNEFKMEFSFH